MIELKRFTREDWYGFCGATRFRDGNEPLIGEFKVGSQEWVIVVDGNPDGPQITNCETGEFYFTHEPVNLLFQLRRYMTEADFGQMFETNLIVECL